MPLQVFVVWMLEYTTVFVCVPAVTRCVYSNLCVCVMQNALVSVCGIDA